MSVFKVMGYVSLLAYAMVGMWVHVAWAVRKIRASYGKKTPQLPVNVIDDCVLPDPGDPKWAPSSTGAFLHYGETLSVLFDDEWAPVTANGVFLTSAPWLRYGRAVVEAQKARGAREALREWRVSP